MPHEQSLGVSAWSRTAQPIYASYSGMRSIAPIGWYKKESISLYGNWLDTGVNGVPDAEGLVAWINLATSTVLGFYLMRVGVGALRRLRFGEAGVEVAAWVTVSLLGTGIAVATALGGSRLAFVVVRSLPVTPVLGIWLQVAGALICSDIAHRLFGRWFAWPLHAWFRGEEAKQVGG